MDTAIAIWVHNLLPYTPFYQTLFKSFSMFGTGLFITLIAILTSLIFILIGKLHKAHILLLSAIFSGITSTIIKHIVARPRPDLWPPLEHLKSASFPSGHVLVGTVVYGILTIYLAERDPKKRSLFYGIYILLLAAIGLSRIYLGVHWPTDVIGGYAIGAFVLAIMTWWYHKGGIARAVRIGIGLTALVLGIIGLLLPLIPGIPLIIGGALLVFSNKPILQMISGRKTKSSAIKN